MTLEKARLSRLRNYQDEVFFFDPNVNLILGENAQGKTNLLEAIYLACIGKPFRTPRLKDMISFQADTMELRLIFEREGVTKDFRLQTDGRKKTFRINHQSFERRADLFGEFPMVLFSPEHLRMIKDGPSERRDFLDREISLFSKSYFYNLVSYQRTLSERNALLREREPDAILLDIYDENLYEYGSFVYEKRRQFLEELKPIAKQMHALLSSEREELELSYETDFDPAGFQTKLRERRDRDKLMHTTGIGVHLDDIKVTLSGLDVRKFGSQGQVRSASLSMFLALLPFIEVQTKTKPIVLLDDVFSELDLMRRRNILGLIAPYQVFITATDREGLEIEGKEIYIASGRVKEDNFE